MNNFPWNRIPVIKLIIPFLCGILISLKLEIPLTLTFLLSVSLLVPAILILKMGVKQRYRLRYVQGAFIIISVLSAACFMTNAFKEINKKYHFKNDLARYSMIIGKVTELPEEKEKTFKSVIQVVSILEGNKVIHKRGKVLVYFRKDFNSDHLEYGDVIVFKNKIKEIDPPGNPGQFNFKDFLSNKQIYHQAFLEEGEWHPLKQNHAIPLIKKIIHIRILIIEILKQNIPGDDESAIAQALIAGYKTDLSFDVRQSFASTGAMHVLAVSGLHVGIIFLVFSKIFFFLKRVPYGNYLFLLINLLVLWFYAILTGLSPSVLRACAMFSFVLIGQSIRRSTNVFSSIYTSAFILLLIDPYFITQVGFQLSYAAVLGIIVFQPELYGLIHTKKKWWIINSVWSLTAVSIAAQLATFPLGLLYFTQFPVYFLVSNLIVIPAATLIMYCGFSFLIFTFCGIELISGLLAKLLNLLLLVLNKSVLIIQNFPHGLIEEVHISTAMTLILYALIIFTFLLIVKKNKSYLILAVASFLLFLSGYTYWHLKASQTKELVFYSIKGNTLIGLYDGQNIVFYGDSLILQDYETLKYNTFRDVWRHGQKADKVMRINFGEPYQSDHLYIKNNLIQFYDKMIVLVDKKVEQKSLGEIQEGMLLVLREGVFFNFKENQIKQHFLVFDGSTDYYKRRLWVKLANDQHFRHTDVIESGAYKIDIE